MSDQRWRRVEKICHDALERGRDERRAFVLDACGGDETLLAEVESLLANASAADESGLGIRDLGLELVGRQIGVYHIVSLLGAGGMGEVYRARDTRLHRDVAMKVLPAAFTLDPDRRARIEREARMLASFNHPNIGAIHGLVEEGDLRCLVLELVEGITLAERLARGPLPIAEVLRYARQMADALDAAHQKGIVHRDLKPANIKIAPDGTLKILDFGLARASAEHSDVHTSEAVTVATRQGAVLGTPAYMSPEQARGDAVDKRADIWSFGCVVYEMLTGTPVFGGRTTSDRIAATLEREPDWNALPRNTPSAVRRLLRRCLEKDPVRRLRDIADARFELEEDSGGANEVITVPRTSRRALWSIAALSLVLVVAAGIAALVARGWLGNRPNGLPIDRVSQTIASQLTNYDGTEAFGAISPDGRSFVFVSDMGGTPDIWLRQIAGGELLRLTADPAVETWLVFAPNGEDIYFTRTLQAETSVWRVGVLGGEPRKVLNDARAPALSKDGRHIASFARESGAGYSLTVSGVDGDDRRALVRNILGAVDISRPAWSPDGRHLVYTAGGLFAPRNLFAVQMDDGAVRQVTRFARSSEGTSAQAWLPDGRHLVVAYSATPHALAASDLGIVDIETGSIVKLTTNVSSGFVAPSLASDGGRLLVTSTRQVREVWKVPLGSDPLSNGNAAIRLLDESVDPMWTYVTRDGRMLLFNNAVVGSRNLWTMPLDRSAAPRQITSVPGNAVMHSSLSPDGAHVAFASSASGNSDIWVQHVDGSDRRQLTNDAAADAWPVWSPDGRTIMFASLRDAAWETRQILASGGPAEKVVDGFFRGDWISKPDGTGTWVVTSSSEGGGVHLLDFERRKVVWEDRPPLPLCRCRCSVQMQSS
jgi:serine/threonine protein kinase/Tol biopolymer transport system component